MDRRDYAYDERDEHRAALEADRGRYDHEDERPPLRDIVFEPGDDPWAYRGKV